MRSTPRSRTPSDPGAVRMRSARSRAATTAAGSGSKESRDGRFRAGVVGGPPVAKDQIVEGQAPRPAAALESRGRRAFVRPADAQPAERDNAGRRADQGGQVGRIEEGDPAEPQPLGPGRQPEVLDGAGAGPQVGIDEGGPPEHPGGLDPPVAADHQPDGSLPDALEIQVQKVTAGVGRQGRGLVETGPVGQQCGARPGAGVAHQDEPPGL